jgi:IPT/TIG domain
MTSRFRNLKGSRRVLAVAAVTLLAAAVGALAYWTAHGSGTATGSVNTLAAPTIASATPGQESAALTWTTVTAPGSGEVAYYVSRDGGAAGGDCPTSSSPSSATSCADSGVSPGSHSYTVTAIWRSWTATSSSANVSVISNPTVTSTSPSSRGQGAASQTIKIIGSGFVSGASLATSFSGTGITVESTTFKSSTEVTATITVESGATVGKRTVTVTNGDAGVGTLANGFEVTAKPTVTSTSPSSRGQGAASQTIKIIGSGFVSGASLATSFSGTGITVESTTFKSSTEVTAKVTVESGATTGARTVTVTNGDAGTGSLANGFEVNAGPTVESTTPSSRGQGASKQTITVKGSNFVSGATSSFGAGITVESTSFVSSTELTATITVESGAATGARTVTVTNPDAGVGSLASAFTVNAKPTVTSTSPSSRGQGAATQTIKVTGSGFVSGASLATSFSGTGIAVNSTTFVSATEVTASITVESGATVGKRTVTVTNGDAGVGTSGEIFTVNAGPTVTSASPSSGDVGGAENVTIKGANFVSGATSSFGAGITVNSTTFVSATELTAKITIEAGATTGVRTVTVTNLDAGVGSKENAFTVNGAPTVTSTSPSSRGQGASKQSIAIKGTNFESGAGLAASFSGTGITVESTSFVSSTEVTATITIASNATTGTREVTVTNPDTTKASLTNAFTVNAGPTVSSPTKASPAKTGHNSKASVSIVGTNFVTAPTITLSNSEFSVVGEVKFNSSTSLTVEIKESGSNNVKSDLTVTNPDGGSVTCVECVST